MLNMKKDFKSDFKPVTFVIFLLCSRVTFTSPEGQNSTSTTDYIVLTALESQWPVETDPSPTFKTTNINHNSTRSVKYEPPGRSHIFTSTHNLYRHQTSGDLHIISYILPLQLHHA